MSHPCPRYEPELSAYLDGETTPELRAEIESHVRVCDACRAALTQLRGVSRTLRRWDAQETRYAASTGFRNRVFSRVGAEGVSPRTNTMWRIAAGVGFVAAGAVGFSLIAPRLRTGENDDVAGLSQSVQRLTAAVQARPVPVAKSAATPSAAEVQHSEPLGPVVTRPDPDDVPVAPPAVPEVWEQRGDGRFLRDALPDHDTYARERGILALEEQLQRAKESLAGTSGHVTTAPPAPPSALATFLGEARVTSSNYPAFEQIQVWPIEVASARGGDPSRLVPCDQAIAQEILSVTEGPLREVVAVNNDTKRPVLVLAGDVLAGGKQDRVAREDVLVAPGQKLSIPAYTCGRERPTTYITFRHSDGIAMPDLRAMVAADQALLSGGIDQDQFDDAVGRTVNALASPRGLGSLDYLFSNPQLGRETDRLMKNFEKRLDGAGVVGFAFSAGSQILGVEMFGDHATFAAHRTRVLRSYLMAAKALDRMEGVPPSRDAVAKIVADAPRSAFHADAQSGSGTLSVFRGVEGGAFGFGLVDGSRVVHALLFTSVPTGVDGTAARGGHRGPGSAPPPVDSGHGNATRGGESGGGGVEPK